MNKGGFLSLASLASLGLCSIVACSSSNHIAADGGSTLGSCSPPPTVEDTNLTSCKSCTASASCTPQAPLEGCCTWVGEPAKTLARATTLHRYSASGDPTVDLSCNANPGMLGTPQMVTLTGYVWLFSSGQDSAGVKVEVFQEANPTTPTGALGTKVGEYTTTSTDAVYPGDTSWNTKCNSPGCSFRQYTIKNVPTETPLIIKTSDGSGGSQWVTVYDYNIYFSNSKVGTGSDGGAPTASYDATAAASGDPETVANTLGRTWSSSTDGLLAGEVHDCGDVRLAGATVGSTVAPDSPGIFYFTSDEGDPLPDTSQGSAGVTSILGLFGGINVPAGKPIRVTAMGKDPADSSKFVMLGTYVVQAYAGAVTAVSLRGRRPWQP